MRQLRDAWHVTGQECTALEEAEPTNECEVRLGNNERLVCGKQGVRKYVFQPSGRCKRSRAI